MAKPQLLEGELFEGLVRVQFVKRFADDEGCGISNLTTIT
jgi:hypothetical protein